MRKATAIGAGLLAMALAAPAVAGLPSVAGEGRAGASSLPETLDAFYPPRAGQPVYLARMLELETSFSGIVVDLMEDDVGGARGSFDGFARAYREISELVPEWKQKYPGGPVRELGEALAAGDRKRAMSAFAELGGVCHRCHVEAMVPVQQKYHWGDFGAVAVRDPLSGAETGYPQFKQFLAANLAGITVDLRQGQTDYARKQFEGFRARFQALSESCDRCHEKKSRYYVDREVQDLVGKIGEAFGNRTVAADEVIALAGTIGRESCFKCHLVHLPSAFAGGAGR